MNVSRKKISFKSVIFIILLLCILTLIPCTKAYASTIEEPATSSDFSGSIGPLQFSLGSNQ